jgi:hypothetical protein
MNLLELHQLRAIAKGKSGELRQHPEGWTLHATIAGEAYTVRPKHPPARVRVFKTVAAAIRAAKYCGMSELRVGIYH